MSPLLCPCPPAVFIKWAHKTFPKLHQIARKCSKIQTNSKNFAGVQGPQIPFSLIGYVLVSCSPMVGLFIPSECSRYVVRGT